MTRSHPPCPAPAPGPAGPRGAHPGRTRPRRAAVAVAEAGQPEAARLRGAAVHADGALPAPAPGPRALHAPHRAAHESGAWRGPPGPAAAPAPAHRGPVFRSPAGRAGAGGRSSAPGGRRPRSPRRRRAGPGGPRPPPGAAGPGPWGPEGTDGPRGRRLHLGRGSPWIPHAHCSQPGSHCILRRCHAHPYAAPLAMPRPS